MDRSLVIEVIGQRSSKQWLDSGTIRILLRELCHLERHRLNIGFFEVDNLQVSVGDIDLVKKMYGCETSVTGDNDLENDL